MKTKVTVRDVGRILRFGNGAVEFGFDTKANGALVSIRDKSAGWQSIRDRQAPKTSELHRRETKSAEKRWQFVRDRQAPKTLFRFALRGKDAGVRWLDSREARRFHWDQRLNPDKSVTLILETSGFPGSSCSVTLEITLSPGSALSAWRMRVTGVEHESSVCQATYPIVSGVLKVGDHAAGECIATPRQSEGYVFHNPYPVADSLPLMAGRGPETPAVGMGEFSQVYPGSQSMQLLLYYNDHAGLYLATHDSEANVKSFACGRMADWGQFPVLSISHFPSESPGRDVAFDYETMVGTFHGDWFDGADIYKAWARKQWWCEKKLAERDIAGWMRRGFGVWQMSNYHIPEIKLNHSLDQIAREVNGLSKEIGVPLLALIFNFEKGGAWTGPKGFFPPKEGDKAFRAAMSKLRRAGNYGFIYMPGGNWYVAIDSYQPPFDSREAFEKDGRPNGVADPKGVVKVYKFYDGWHSARLCPTTELTRRLTRDLVLGSIRRGCPVVQIDNFPCGGAEACYDSRHGHPRGHGPWYTQAWREMLEDVRRRAKTLDPDCALTTEGIAETYIPYLDMYDHRGANMEYFGHRHDNDPMGGEIIPLFQYVYGGYLGAYTAAYPECNRPEVLYWTRCLGKSLAQGVVPTGGRYWPEPKQSNPATLAFYKKVVRAAAQECWRFIMFGEMLRPSAIRAPTIEAAYVRFTGECLDHLLPHNRHVVTDSAVQHSAWRAEDGTIGCIFVNIGPSPVEFDFTLSAYSSKAGRYAVDVVVDGKRSRLHKAARLPRRQNLRIAPFSVTLVEVKTRS